MSSLHPQDAAHAASLSDPASFWRAQAQHLVWHKFPSRILSSTRARVALPSDDEPSAEASHDSHAWFEDGEISTCYNCVDRHVDLEGRGDAPAVYYDSPVTGVRSALTYRQLRDEVALLAGVLRGLGVKKGDVVMVYMPLLPATLISLLATSRLGATHAVVFGGFAAPALAQRIESARPVVLLTASCGVDGAAKPPLPYQPLVEQAARLSRWKPRGGVVVWQREGRAVLGGPEGRGGWELPRWDMARVVDKEVPTFEWQALLEQARKGGAAVKDCVPVPATSPLYVLYTSGTTGAPKGVVRDAGGHAVGLHLSMRATFGIHPAGPRAGGVGPSDVVFTASDLGWVVGHGYMLYGPLLVGAATVLYEGKPVGTPDAGALWQLVERYGATVLFTAPTALRAVRREDPRGGGLKEVGRRGGLRSLKALFLAGERSEPRIVKEFEGLLKKWGRPDAEVVDNWWTTEVGSPITARSLSAHATFRPPSQPDPLPASSHPVLPLKAGSAGKPMPGFDVRIVDDEGVEVSSGKMGNVVLALPLAPTAFRTLWRDDEEQDKGKGGRYYRSYLKRFDGRWLDTGDAGMVDQDGYVHIMARTDDVLNVAGHRLSSGAIEQAITSHPLVAEGCVVGIPDALKGQLPFAFVTLATSSSSSAPPITTSALLSEINALVRSQVGPIATLGGLIFAAPPLQRPVIPKTRSGKTLRRTLRALVDNAVLHDGDPDPPEGARRKGYLKVEVPATVEDAGVVDEAKDRVREYFREFGDKHAHAEHHDQDEHEHEHEHEAGKEADIKAKL